MARGNPDIPSYDGLMSQVQEALTAMGDVEKQLGAFEGDPIRDQVRDDINTAVRALQRVRDRIQGSVG